MDAWIVRPHCQQLNGFRAVMRSTVYSLPMKKRHLPLDIVRVEIV